MTIDAIAPGTIITINATDFKKSIRLESQVIELSESDRTYLLDHVKGINDTFFVILDLITENDKMVEFASKRVNYTLTGLVEDRPYSWEDVQIYKIKLPEQGACDLVLSNKSVDTFNRRTEYRQWIGQYALCKFGTSKIGKDIFVRDLSPMGIGFLCSNELPVELEEKVFIQLHYEYKNAETGEYTSKLYNIDAKIVRFVSTSNNQLLVGCRMSRENSDLTKMMASKQRASLTVGKRDTYKMDRDIELARAMHAKITGEAALAAKAEAKAKMEDMAAAQTAPKEAEPAPKSEES